MAVELPQFAPVTLEGRHLRLEPLTRARHFEAVCEAAADPAIWSWYVYPFTSRERVEKMFDQAEKAIAAGTEQPFAQIDKATGRFVGSTRYMNIDALHRRAEIGFTWLVQRAQRTPVNTEAKFMLLRHAFETLGLNRVEFKTDVLNEKSRRALERIGARQEGIFRSHMVTEAGRIRDSVYYGIVSREWPAVKARLETMMARDPAKAA